jgi:ABC-2 type transport system ATP-binding protein
VGLVRSHFPAPAPAGELLETFGLARVANRLAGGLSAGERRRLALALAFAGRPRLLVLDEPSAGLDVEARRAAWASIRAFRDGGGAVLLTTHHLEEAEALADHIVVLDRGRIRAAGTAPELRARSGLARVTLRAAELPALPQSTRIERSNGLYVLHTPEPEAIVALLVASGLPFAGLEVARPSLEDAFLQITGSAT